jgi:hypothetical protein
MRDTTERPEAVEAGTVRLVGTDVDNIVNNVALLLNDETEYAKMSFAHNPYGDGKASSRIIHALLSAGGIESGVEDEFSETPTDVARSVLATISAASSEIAEAGETALEALARIDASAVLSGTDQAAPLETSTLSAAPN